MIDKIKDIAKLFQEKKYSELIYLIETSFQKIPNEILNILAISRLLENKNEQSLIKAIEEFEQVYLNENKTQTGLNGLINYLDSSADYYDYSDHNNTLNAENSCLEKSVAYFKEAERYFGYEPRLTSVAIRVFKRLNDLGSTLDCYQKLYDEGDITLSTFCSWIFLNNYKYDWSQKNFLEYSKQIEKYIPLVPEEKLFNLSSVKCDKIKIGFVSSDVNKVHSITFFLKTILSSYDNTKFEIFLFLNSNKEDEGTLKFKSLVDHSINITDLNDVECINTIRKLNLNIIFDLMGVTSTNRVSLFKNRLAPVQISWLGYCNTMGIKNMDYLISDQNLIYENEHNLYSEKVLYLPNIWNCHCGFDFERAENPSPYLLNKYITFGSFNNFNKINEDVIHVWANILNRVNGSKLILKSSIKKDLNNFKLIFEKLGVIKSVVFLPKSKSFEDHIKSYNQIDIALDTFPYNGVTTSFEALWMGVPVVTMKGYNFNSRCGESINTNIQMQKLIAKNKEEYVSIAKNLANDKADLLKIRKKVFDTAISSPLFDKKKFSSNFYELIEKVKQI